MAELSDNVRWLVTNLIDKDQRIGMELQRRGEEYAAAGRPRDGSLQRVCFVKFLWAVSAFLLVRLSGCF